jgi:hypothetical protein
MESQFEAKVGRRRIYPDTQMHTKVHTPGGSVEKLNNFTGFLGDRGGEEGIRTLETL